MLTKWVTEFKHGRKRWLHGGQCCPFSQTVLTCNFKNTCAKFSQTDFFYLRLWTYQTLVILWEWDIVRDQLSLGWFISTADFDHNMFACSPLLLHVSLAKRVGNPTVSCGTKRKVKGLSNSSGFIAWRPQVFTNCHSNVEYLWSTVQHCNP